LTESVNYLRILPNVFNQAKKEVFNIYCDNSVISIDSSLSIPNTSIKKENSTKGKEMGNLLSEPQFITDEASL